MASAIARAAARLPSNHIGSDVILAEDLERLFVRRASLVNEIVDALLPGYQLLFEYKRRQAPCRGPFYIAPKRRPNRAGMVRRWGDRRRRILVGAVLALHTSASGQPENGQGARRGRGLGLGGARTDRAHLAFRLNPGERLTTR